MGRAEAIEYFHDYNWNLVPISPKGKNPLVDDLKGIYLLPESREDFENLFPDDNRNIAVATGVQNATAKEKNFLNVLDIERNYLSEYLCLIATNPLFQKLVEHTRISHTRDGGRHVFFNTDKPLKSLSIKKDGEHIIDFQAWQSYCLVPPSIVKNRYLWENPDTTTIATLPIDQVKELLGLWGRGGDVRPVSDDEFIDEIAAYYAKKNLQGLSDGLSKDLLRYLKTGQWYSRNYRTKEGNPDRSRIEYAIIYRLVALGYGRESIEAFFRINAYDGAKFQKNSGHLHVEIAKAKEWYKSHKGDFDKEADELSAILPYMDLKTYEKACLSSILTICKRVGRFEGIALPQREIAIAAGIDQKTVSRNLGRLTERGILKLEKKGNVRYSAIYTVESKKKIEPHFFTSGWLEGLRRNFLFTSESFSQGNFSSDSFARDCLGKTGALIISMLNGSVSTKFSAKDFSEALNISTPTVRKRLDELQSFDIVKAEKEPTGARPRIVYWIENPITDEELVRLAHAKGTLGKSIQRKKNIKQQRADWKEYQLGKAMDEGKKTGVISGRYDYLFDEQDDSIDGIFG